MTDVHTYFYKTEHCYTSESAQVVSERLMEL